ncbi:MAG: AAA family ATPase [Promethearchaeota archaeon]
MSKSDEVSAPVPSPLGNQLDTVPEEPSQKSLMGDVQRTLIQKIIIKDFLSFENDEVEFDPYFSIIIGPNGAGKSTIYQALKFVLGSNDYDGRYGKWADFIRTGTKEAIVQVHIIFNNDEYIIQRTVQANSTPKFLFKRPEDKKLSSVSVKVIKEFTETIQIDPNNLFSFMSQGNIDTIKDFKGNVLCEFVEKGIGLSDIRQQIVQIHHKIIDLQKEEQVLVSQKDHLNFQLTELEPKIQQLKKKRELEIFLEKLKLELTIARKNEIASHIGQLEQEIHNLTVEFQKIQSQLNEIEKQIEQKESEKITLETVLQQKIEARSEIKAQLAQINSRIAEWTDEKKKIAEIIQNLEAQIKFLFQEKKQLAPDLVLTQTKRQKLEERSNTLSQLVQNLVIEERELHAALHTHQKILFQYEAEQQIVSSLNDQLEEYESTHQNFEKEITQKIQEIKKIKIKLQKFQWFLNNPTENLPTLMRKEHQNISNQKDSINQDLRDIQSKYEDLVHSMEKIKSTVLDKSFPKPKQIQVLMDEIKDRKLNCIGPLIDYVTYEDIYRLAVESIFGFRVLFSFIARDSETFLLLTNLVKKYGVNCTIYKERKSPVEPLSPMPNQGKDGIFGYLVNKITPIFPDPAILKVIHTVAGKTLVVKDHLTGDKYIEQYRYKNWIVTLDGDQIRPKKLVLEARPQLRKSKKFGFYSVAQAKQKLNEISNLSEQNRNAYNRRIKDFKEEERKLAILEERLKDVDQLLHEYKRMEIKTTLKNNAVKKRKDYFQKINTKQQEIDKKNTLITELKSQLPDALVSSQSRLDEIPELISLHNKTLEEYTLSGKEMQIALETLKLRDKELDLEISTYAKQKTELHTNLKSQDSAFYQLFQESMQLTKQIRIMEDSERNDKQTLSNITQEFKDLHCQKDGTLYNKIQLESQIKHIQDNLATENQKLDAIKKAIQDNQWDGVVRPIQEIEQDIISLTNQINQIHVDDSVLFEKEKIENLMERITEKRQIIQREITEAAKAQNQLEKNFYTTFNQKITYLQTSINEKLSFAGQNFQVNLSLQGEIETLSLSIMTTTTIGTEIVKYPLAAVSGGQRSMVGICLMLSLNYLNPSAVNIYDECDMFLDERNAQTIARLIHKLAATGIQFILLMPSKNMALLKSANKVIGVSRNGKFGPSFVQYSRIF